MKLFIQIPCLNEERTLPEVIASLPKRIEGVDEIRTLVIDDGSTDKTVDVAKRIGVDYIVVNGRTLGLAKSFNNGLEASLFLGADIIVNTDGDNQYKAQDIPKLVKPIVEKRSDIVIGCRDIDKHKEFSWLKKRLQKSGSRLVRRISQTDVPDATSGFRALSRMAAIKFSVMSSFSYTLEMLIQAGRAGLKVGWVPIETNPKTRESRLYKSTTGFIFQQLKTIVIIYLFYYPMHFFNCLAAISFTVSLLMGGRIAYFLWLSGPGHLKFKTGSGMLLLFSLIATALFFITGMLSSVLSGLRFLIVDIRSRVRSIELKENIMPLGLHIVTNDTKR
jgi:glycosyltransferase involved in cell wall biosynthesis